MVGHAIIAKGYYYQEESRLLVFMDGLKDWFSLFAFIHCVGMFFATIELVLGNVSIDAMKDVLPVLEEQPPSIDIVLTALNEEETIEPAVKTMLALDYPNFRIIAVNDRSTDNTGKILERLRAENDRLTVIHIETLPEGWLGKINAMQSAADIGTGDYILFTDADIHFDASVLKRAINYIKQNSLDHLTVFPHETSNNMPYALFVLPFLLSFSYFSHPWFARIKQIPLYIGIGAFNMVRRSVFSALKGYHSIKMRPDDDVKLGKLIKLSGYRQSVLFGRDMVQLEWYPSTTAMFQGMMKNAFAGLNYIIPLAVLGPLALFVGFTFPVIALLASLVLGNILAAWCYFVVVMCIVIAGLNVAQKHGVNPWGVLTLPLTMNLMVLIVWGSMIKTLKNRGIYWRNTFYPLEQLKKNSY